MVVDGCVSILTLTKDRPHACAINTATEVKVQTQPCPLSAIGRAEFIGMIFKHTVGSIFFLELISQQLTDQNILYIYNILFLI